MTDRIDPVTGEVHEEATDLKDLVDAYVGLNGRVEITEKKLGELDKEVGGIAAIVEAHLATWPDLDDELEHWVEEWLIPTFSLAQALDHWKDDPGIRSELMALWIGYRRMLQALEASFDPISWHDALARVLARIPEHRQRHTESTRQLRTGVGESGTSLL